ncbi:MAG: hypothetical protein IJG62_00150 [Synergistaceae bacterium]|nr:hypothetical protein [Synergistaceae bacterium]
MAENSPEFQEYRRTVTLLDDEFMSIVFDNNIPCVEEMLKIILKRDDLIVKSARTQRDFQGFERSVTLDVFAVDSAKTNYNIEFQNTNEGADFRRARFHGGMIDVHSLKPGQPFKDLPECYVIFITQHDVIGYGKMIYTMHRYIDGDLQPFDDGSHIIYVNASAKDDGSQLWKLIHDLQCPDPDKMFLPRLRARVSFLKGQEEGDKIMGSAFEKAVGKIVEKDRKNTLESVALDLIKFGKMNFDEIAQVAHLTLDRIEQLAASVQAAEN